MRPARALVAALLLGACHRHVAEVTLDADEAARNATAAKTLADLAAADAASRAPLPVAAPPIHREVASRPAPEQPDEEAEPASDQGNDE